MATFTLVILVVIIISFFVIFQTKKNRFILDRMEMEKKLDQEIAKSKIEMREQSLKNIAWELHDHVGQLLSIAKMQLSIMQPALPQQYHEQLNEINKLIGDSLQEIRLLSKTLNPDVISTMGLTRSIGMELQRFNKLNFLEASLSITGDETPFDQRDEIIVFRILQEFFLNVIKHSKATSLIVSVTYLADRLVIRAQDNGVGFDAANIVKGSGLINMKSRARMIGATYALQTAPRQGVTLLLEYPFKQLVYAR